MVKIVFRINYFCNFRTTTSILYVLININFMQKIQNTLRHRSIITNYYYYYLMYICVTIVKQSKTSLFGNNVNAAVTELCPRGSMVRCRVTATRTKKKKTPIFLTWAKNVMVWQCYFFLFSVCKLLFDQKSCSNRQYPTPVEFSDDRFVC